MQELLRTGIYFCKLEVNLPIHHNTVCIIYFNCLLTICILYDIIYVKKDNLKHARTCVYNINYHIVLSVKYHQKMYKKFPDLCQQLWKGEFWNYSYYLEIIDDISEETIRMYIEHQSKQY